MAMHWPALVQAETLAPMLGQAGLVVVDCRFSLADTDRGMRDFAQGHVPGARYAHLDHDLSGASDDPRAGRHPWPPREAFAATMQAWGVDAGVQLVAYDDGDGSVAARLWCLARAVGHDAVAVLDGGWARWTALGLPVEPGAWEPPRRRTSTDVGRGNSAPPWQLSQVLDADAVQAHLDGDGLLLDARAAPRFRGEVEPIDRVAGHVPGALNRPFADNLDADGRFKAPTVLAREFRALLGERPPGSLVSMCGSGVTGCHHLLAMAHAGLPVGRLYAGSWSGWSADPTRPVARG